jgi:N-acetylmuramoyl-L-alanine amidase
VTPSVLSIGRRRRAWAAALAAALLSLSALAGCGVRPPSAVASGSPTSDGTATVAATPDATASTPGVPTPDPTATLTAGPSQTPTADWPSTGTSASTSGPPLAGMVAASGAYDKPSTGGATLAPTASGPLSGRTVEVDPGHNGVTVPSIDNALVPAGNGQKKACNTSGTEALDGTAEHVLTWAIGVRLVGLLRSLGATVVLTRPSDGGVGPCVNERAAIANRLGVDLVLSIHGDGALVSGARGFHVIVSTAMADSSLEAPSVAVAQTLVTELGGLTPLPRSTYVGAGTGILRRGDIAGVNLLSGAPGVMLEVGNLRNAADWSYLKTDAAKEAIAQALAATAVATLS